MKPLPPAGEELGLRLLMVGVPIVTSKEVEAEVPWFPSTTVIENIPGLAIMACVTAPVSLVELENVVVRAVEFHMILAPETKSEPFTVRVKFLPPAVADVGLRLVTLAPVMSNGRAPE